MKRKLLLTLIAIHCIVMQAWAYDFSAVNSDGKTIYYNITSNTEPYTVEVTYKGDYNYDYKGVVNIPYSVEYNDVTYLVTAIGEEAFNKCLELVSVSIPNTVTSIGPKAFEVCSVLAVEIPNSVTFIGNNAFNGVSLTSIVFPNSLTNLSEDAVVCWSNSLVSAVLPSTITDLGWAMFCQCVNLDSLTCYAEVPPTTNGWFCGGVSPSMRVYVPKTSVEIYQNTYPWSNYNIQAIPDYLTLTATSDNTVIGLDVIGSPNISTLQYSYDGSNWNNITGAITFDTLQNGEFIKFRSENQVSYSDGNNIIQFNDASGSYVASGNINTLINYTDVDNVVLGSYAFNYLFSDCTHLIDASNLLLPSTTLASWCYLGLFRGCTSLIGVPELPATTLGDFCYYNIFGDCTSLTMVPELPATNLMDGCYWRMFEGCTALTNAPNYLQRHWYRDAISVCFLAVPH